MRTIYASLSNEELLINLFLNEKKTIDFFLKEGWTYERSLSHAKNKSCSGSLIWELINDFYSKTLKSIF